MVLTLPDSFIEQNVECTNDIHVCSILYYFGQVPFVYLYINILCKIHAKHIYVTLKQS